MQRRDLLIGGAASAAATALSQLPAAAAQPQRRGGYWPDGIRLPISLSLMFHSGAQSRFGAYTPFGHLVPPAGTDDLPTITWYRYGATEGIPRALEMLAKLKVKATSHMSGLAVETYPDVARSIVQAGHEAADHGWNLIAEATMTDEQERDFIQRSTDTIRKVTGQRPVGYNAPGLRGTGNVLSNLHSLGFKYHTDDVSRDEPFIVQLDGKRDIVVVPHAPYINDMRAYESRGMSNTDFLNNLKLSFDQLYEESASRRRMMSIVMHDRMVRPEHARTMAEAIRYMLKHPGVAFMTKIDIARFITTAKDAIREPIGAVYPTIPGLYRG